MGARPSCRGEGASTRSRATLVVTALIVAFLALACSEEGRAKEAFEAALADSDLPLDEQRAAFEAIVERWPESEAAGKARRELDSISSLESSARRGLALRAWDAVRRVAQAAERYRLRHGRYPESFDALVPRHLEGPVLDPWGGPVLYRRDGSGYRVVCYGADRMPGGEGEGADLMLDDRGTLR
jgi:hypothetical protein